MQRKLKNVVNKYTEAQKQVREATCNDNRWPTSILMESIAEKTYNRVELNQISEMLAKRLKDYNKHVRHTKKALLVLRYVLLHGSKDFIRQWQDGIYLIEPLTDFKNSQPEGEEIRRTAISVCSLLRDEQMLDQERAHRALNNARREHIQGFGSPDRSAFASRTHEVQRPNFWKPPPVTQQPANAAFDSFRPQNTNEEELHMQVALVLSKEEYDLAETRRRDEEAKILMAIEENKRENEMAKKVKVNSNGRTTTTNDGSTLYERVDTALSVAPASLPDPWAPVGPSTSFASVPSCSSSGIPIDDPWGTSTPSVSGSACALPPAFVGPSNPAWPGAGGDMWSLQGSLGPSLFESSNNNNNNNSSNSNAETFLGPQLMGTAPVDGQRNGANSDTTATANGSAALNLDAGDALASEVSGAETELGTGGHKRTPADFLGEHKDLVDLDQLIVVNPISTNPFATIRRDANGRVPSNPFLSHLTTKPTLNDLAPSRPVGGPQLALPAPHSFPHLPTEERGFPAPPPLPTTSNQPMATPWHPNASDQANGSSLNPFY